MPRPRTLHLLLVALLLGLFASTGAFAQCPAPGDCLTAHPTPGCEDPDCCSAVCSFQPMCCNVAWDANCAQAANTLCPGLCGSSSAGGCFAPHETPACNDATCCELICAMDPFCCSDTWDLSCALLASLSCETGGPGKCGDPNAGSCFIAHSTGACSDRSCCEAVCSINPDCCEVVWDQLCATVAAQTCNTSCEPMCPPDAVIETEPCGQNKNDPCYFPVAGNAAQSILCGKTICGAIRNQTTIHDVDVYKVLLLDNDGDGLVRLKVTFDSSFVGFAAVRAATCGPVADGPFHVASSECVAASASMCLAQGFWWVVVSPGEFPVVGEAPPIECGTNSTYTLKLECSEDRAPPCSPGSGDCFTAHANGGCADVECCQMVCAITPECCDQEWDVNCAVSAIELCDGPLPANDHCVNATSIGDGSAAFNTIAADTDGPPLPEECDEGFGTSFSHDVWFRYTPTVDGVVVASCCNAVDFDVRFAAYSGTCDDLTLIACNDDDPACDDLVAAKLAFITTCGEAYYLRIGGFSGDMGTGTVTLVSGGDACASKCAADINGDGTVGGADLGVLLGNWGTAGPGDLNSDGVVNGADLGILLGAWGPCA